ncbi:MAG: HipA N-terminal domain-containing protein [Elusimicrobia bacterium]|nr:HipA N-terminal domain-containing protein [Elusimicrobiota bacterium]
MKTNYRRAVVYSNNQKAGVLEETANGYKFTYEKDFMKKNVPVSVSLPLQTDTYESDALFPFFQGLLPEGWYLEMVASTLKIDREDDYGILLATCKETVGAISIEEIL